MDEPARTGVDAPGQAAASFTADQFTIDWTTEEAICAAGCRSVSWSPAVDNRDNGVIKRTFATTDCRRCPEQANCTPSTPPRRTLTIRPRDQYTLLQAARARQKTDAFNAAYGLRSGIEGTISPGIRGFEMRRSRYIGQAKTHLQNVLTATAMNVARFSEWFAETPRAKTRRSAFERLYQAAA